MKHFCLRLIIASLFLLISSLTIAESTDFSISFAPPPITPPSEDTQYKLGINYLGVSINNDDFDDMDFEMYGISFLQKNCHSKFCDWISASMGSGEDQSGDTSLLSLNLAYGLEFHRAKDLAWGLGLGMSLFSVDIYSSQSFTTSTHQGNTNTFFEASSNSDTLTLNLMFNIQKRYPLSASIGLTPYYMGSFIFYSRTEIETRTHQSITGPGIFQPAQVMENSDSFSNDPFLTHQLGFDIDYRRLSLAAFFQSSGDAEITNLMLSYIF